MDCGPHSGPCVYGPEGMSIQFNYIAPKIIITVTRRKGCKIDAIHLGLHIRLGGRQSAILGTVQLGKLNASLIWATREVHLVKKDKPAENNEAR